MAGNEDTTYKNSQSKKEGKDQESIQSSTTPELVYQWESDNVTIRHHKLSFFLSLLVRSYLSITPGSANLKILIKIKKQHKKQNNTKKQNFWLNFCLN